MDSNAYVAISTTFAFIASLLLVFAKRGLFDFLFKRSKNNSRVITKTDRKIFLSYRVFAQITRTTAVELKQLSRSIYAIRRASSKGNKSSRVYFLMLNDLFVILDAKLREYIDKADDTVSKQDHSTILLQLILGVVEEAEEKYVDRDIPKEVIRAFDIVSALNSNWIFKMVDMVVTTADGYYEELADILDVLWSTVIRIVSESEEKALRFNGDIEDKLAKEWNNINLKE